MAGWRLSRFSLAARSRPGSLAYGAPVSAARSFASSGVLLSREADDERKKSNGHALLFPTLPSLSISASSLPSPLCPPRSFPLSVSPSTVLSLSSPLFSPALSAARFSTSASSRAGADPSSQASPTSASNSSPSTPTPAAAPAPAPPQGFLARLLDDKNVVASPSFTNRWLVAIPAFATHMCIGSPWAWSVVSGPLSRELGFVSAAAADWTFKEVAGPVSITFAVQGLSAALAGKWQMRVGARKAMAVAALCFGGGMLVGGLGVAMHSLPLLYLGYGVLSGAGVGLAYTPPVQALVQWFPDRKGLASGMTIAGFGSGALVFTPLASRLLQYFAAPPTYVGPAGSVATQVHDGRMYAEVGGALREVVAANASDIAKLAQPLPEGLYLVGTGASGVAPTLMTMGAGYLAVMMLSAFAIRRPAPGYQPQGYVPPSSPDAVGSRYVPLDKVMSTPQFYLLGTTFFCLACGGMGIFSVAKPMMTEVFGGTLPDIVTPAFASSYVMMLSAGNLGGRLGWALFFDKFGPRTTFHIFTLCSIPLYLGTPLCVAWMMQSPSVSALAVFTATTFTAMSFMGATYALMPAYEASLFGTKNMGAVHGRMLIASAGASLAGPSVLLWLRGREEHRNIMELVAKIPEQQFQDKFGVPSTEVADLIAAKTVTISKLLEALPPGTPDPTPFIYDTTMYALAGLASLAAVTHYLVRPVRKELYVKD